MLPDFEKILSIAAVSIIVLCVACAFSILAITFHELSLQETISTCEKE